MSNVKVFKSFMCIKCICAIIVLVTSFTFSCYNDEGRDTIKGNNKQSVVKRNAPLEDSVMTITTHTDGALVKGGVVDFIVQVSTASLYLITAYVNDVEIGVVPPFHPMDFTRFKFSLDFNNYNEGIHTIKFEAMTVPFEISEKTITVIYKKPTLAFDAEYYLNIYPDLQAAFGNNYIKIIEHWEKAGIYEGRKGSPTFHSQYYVSIYRDLQEAFGNNYKQAIEHWIHNGIAEGRQGTLSFDVQYYLSIYPDLQNAFGTDYAQVHDHWINAGIYEGRQSSVTFNAHYYVSIYSDLQNAFGTDYFKAARHWEVKGIDEGRRGCENFDAIFYLHYYSDLQHAFGANYRRAHQHWITNGRSEGRIGVPQ